MHDKLVKIQKGYIMIDRAKEKIDELIKSKEILDGKQKLEDLKKQQDIINKSIKEQKEKAVEIQEKIKEYDIEQSKIIKYMFSNTRKRTETLNKKKQRKEEIEKEKVQLEKDMMKIFIVIDALKDKMNEEKLSYNEEEKEFIKVVSGQNHKIVRYEDKISSLEKTIRRIRKTIDSEVLSIYDKKRQKNVMVMSRVEDEKCYNCGEQISDDIVEKIRQGKIMECPNCERILYLPEEEADLDEVQDDELDADIDE